VISLVDSHAHLDQPEFDRDRDEVVSRAIESGVRRIVTIGLDATSSRESIDLAEKYPAVYATVGLHPSNADRYSDALMAELRILARHPKVVGVGETGLDFYRKRATREAQERAFRAQLDLAADLGLPVVIHDRDAHEQVVGILDEWIARQGKGPVRRGVMHCFSGDLRMAQRIVAMGFLVSVAGPVTYPNAKRLIEVVQSLPLSDLMVETDCPFLAPQPVRGKRNEPAYVRFTAEKVAQIKGCSLEQVALQTTEGARRLFGLGLAGSTTHQFDDDVASYQGGIEREGE